MKSLVLINPHGGGGKALQVFEEIKKDFEEKKINFELIFTEKEGHAYQIAHQLDYSKFDSIICVSGDGMLNEVVNGLVSRDDADIVCEKVAIGIIPGGTGNGVYLSLGFTEQHAKNIAYSILSKTITRFDVMKTTCLTDDFVKYGILSTSIGFVSDHDVLTEKRLRWLGPRMSMGIAPVYTWLKQREYPATVSYRPFSQSDSIIPVNGVIEKGENEIKIKSKFFMVMGANLSHIASTAMVAPQAKGDDGSIHLILSHSAGYYESLWILLGLENGTHVNHASVEVVRVTSFFVQPDMENLPKEDTFVSVDGELFPIQPFRVELIPSRIKMFSPIFDRETAESSQ